MQEEFTTFEKFLACFCHAGWFIFGIGFLFLPFIIFLYSKFKGGIFSYHCKQAVKFQFIYLLITILSIVIFAIFDINPFILTGFLIFFTLIFMACSVVACIKVINDEYFTYPLC